jgi:hypothetical protein
MKYVATVAVLVVLAVAPSAAFASGSGSQCQTYNPQTCQPLEPPSNGTLPFTGMDLGLLVGGGAALLSVGFVLRRVTRRLN